MAIRGFARADRGPVTAPALDAVQASVLSLPVDANVAVIGAPGSGKTTLVVELVADRVANHGFDPDEIVVLSPDRTTAARLRDELALRLDLPTNGPLARTANSLAFEIVTERARRDRADLPRLVTGGEEDADLAALLAGDIEDGTGPVWPEPLVDEVRGLRSFRSELRELIARMTEYGITPDGLAALGQREQRPEWVAAAAFIDGYQGVLDLGREARFTSAELLRFAVAAIEQAPGERVQRLRLVIVDDLQEATESTLDLLRAFARRGVAIIATGDPDVAANAFRGGEPDALGRLSSVLGLPVTAVVLPTVHRQSPGLRALTSRATQRIGTAAAGSQRAAAGEREAVAGVPEIVTVEAPSAGRVWSSVARVLREHHLTRGVPWGRMAVVLRSGATVTPAARALALSEVPTRTSAGGRPLREHHAARALLLVVDVGSGRTALDADRAVELLLGPVGGLDALGLRRLRLALRAEELAGGGTRSSDALLVDALEAPDRLVTIDHRAARSADRLARILAELREKTVAGGTIEELLWHAWERSGLARPWHDQALASGIVADEANRNLDGVVALFSAAKRYAEREPAAAPAPFLDRLLDSEVPEDTLAPQAAADTVFVTTPPGVVGQEFDVVVVAGLQDGAWPNLRLRNSLLHPQELVRLRLGIDSSTVDERALVLGDELRMFALAVSRATTQVVLAAVANEDEARSVFFSLLPPGTPAADVSGRPPLSLRGLTGRLRRELVAQGRRESERAAVASALARLAAEQVPGASPDDWHGLLEPSTTEPLFLPEEVVPVSPSQLARFEESPLDWFVDSIAGSSPSTPMAVGTIVHWAMETATDPSVDEVWARIESRWGELLFEAPWMAEYQKGATRVLAAGVAEYLGDFRRDGKTLVGAESRFGLDLAGDHQPARVNGSIDRVERAADGSVVIVDLKTGSAVTRQSDIDEHPQLGAYQLAYAEGKLDEFLAEHGTHSAGGAKLLFVKQGVRGKLYREAVQAPLDEEQLEGFRERIRQAATLMAAARFAGVREVADRVPGAASRRLHRVPAVSSDGEPT